MQEEVPDASRLNPRDVGGSAGEHAGFVLHGAADGAEAHHSVHLPAVPVQLAQQRPPRVALEHEKEGRNTVNIFFLVCEHHGGAGKVSLE